MGAVPGAERRRRRRRPGPARDLERDRERRLEDRRPGAELEFAGRLGGHHLRHLGHQRRRRARPHPRPVRPGGRQRGDPVVRGPSLGGLQHRLPHRRRPVGARAAPRRARDRQAHQEQLRVGDPGHRRAPRLRLLRDGGRRRRAEHERRDGLVHRAGRVRDHRGVRLGRVAHAARRPALHRERQRDELVHGRPRQGHRGRGVAGRAARARPELGDPVRLGARAADRDRDRGHAGRPFVRPRRQPAVGDPRHVGADGADAVLAARAALHRLGLSGRRPAAGVRGEAGRVGRHLHLVARRHADGAELRLPRREGVVRRRRLGLSAAGHLQHVGAGLRRPVLHAARPRVPRGPRRADRRRDLRAAAHRDRQRVHGLAVGVQ